MEVVFDGSDDEMWAINKNPSAVANTYFYTKLGMLNSAVENSACSTHFIHKNITSDNSSIGLYVYNSISANAVRCNIRPWVMTDESINSLEYWKTWLAENNIVLQYKLATPTITELDTASQLALNSLETFDDVTHIEIDSRVQPSEVSVDYGVTKNGAYTLKGLLNSENAMIENESLKSQISELTAALVLLSETVNGGATTSSGDVGEEIGTDESTE